MQPADFAAETAPASQPVPAALAAALSPAFLRKLDRLRLVVRHSLSTRTGSTPMPRGAQGSGIELESHKSYGAGDDLRHLDWNAYGRLDELLIKTYRAEREVPLHLFIDTSASMAFPPADGKFVFALALAASLAYISLRRNDPVRIVAIGAASSQLHFCSPVFRHRHALLPLRDFLLQLRPSGQTKLASGISGALRQQRTPGVAVVLSDFLVAPAGYEPGLRELAARGFTIAALRLLGPQECDPSLLFRRGQLTDVESGRHRFITLSAANLSCYQRALAAHREQLQRFCNRHEIAYATADTAAGVDQILFRDLPALGLLR